MHVDSPIKFTQNVSVCTGIRGLERGFERAFTGSRTCLYVEIEAVAIYNLVKQMEQGVLDPAPIWTDLKTTGEWSWRFRDRVHFVIGGYPCQPFSTAGQKKGTDDPRHLWPHIREFMQSTNALGGFFENVENHLNMGFDEVYRDLRAMGYAVEAGVFSAREVGSPQERRRLFILAVRPELIDRMADTYGNANERQSGGFHGPGRKAQGKARQRQRGGHGSPDSGKAMGYTNGQRLQGDNGSGAGRIPGLSESGADVGGKGMADTGHESQQISLDWEQSAEQIIEFAHKEGITLWPAGQGTFQYPWEESRTVIPGLGITVNGYNFRDDFLRLLGNSVVEETAEVALRVLFTKFGINI